jgi:mutator protein MutT
VKPPIVPVSAVLLEKEGKFLVLKRASSGHLPFLWEFPGGKKSANESWRLCARRELLEETDLRAGNLRKVAIRIFNYAERTVEIHFFHCREFSGELNTKDEFKWLRPNEMNPDDFPEANHEVIERLKQGRLFRPIKVRQP